MVSGLKRFSSKLLVVGRLHSVVGPSENESLVLGFMVLVVALSPFVENLYFGFFENFLNLLK